MTVNIYIIYIIVFLILNRFLFQHMNGIAIYSNSSFFHCMHVLESYDISYAYLSRLDSFHNLKLLHTKLVMKISKFTL